MVKRVTQVCWWIGLSVFFGGLMTLGVIVAPAVFQTAAENHMSMTGIVAPPLRMDRQVGGEIFGVILNRFAVVEVVALSLMLVGVAGMIFSSHAVRRSSWILLILWAALAALTGYDDTFVRPSAWALRAKVREAAAAHPEAPTEDALDGAADFARAHQWSETVGRFKAYLLLGMILLAAWRELADRPIPVQSNNEEP